MNILKIRHLKTFVRQYSSCKESQACIINREKHYTANNYASLPVVLKSGSGVCVWDTDGNSYIDFLSGFSSINQGHCHPRILETLCKQAHKLHHTSRSFHTENLATYAEYVTQYFGYQKLLPMNTGVEACETAVKLARKWGYKVKNIEPCKARVIFCDNNFWGRSLAAVSSSTDPLAYENYGPFMPGFVNVPYDDLSALEKELKNPCTCAFMVEPIQGEAGINVPSDCYLQKVRELCTANNVLFIADEIQTGIGRTGKRLCCDYANVKPDILVLGKALSGGVYPVSAVLADDCVMCVITPGTHGSTYGGNPLACEVARTALQIVEDECLSENSYEMGAMFRCGLQSMDSEIVTTIRGKGLLNAIVINPCRMKAYDLCIELMKNGILTKPTHESVIRLSPPLVINKVEIENSLEIIHKSIESMKCKSQK